jgi:hypothetical protein
MLFRVTLMALLVAAPALAQGSDCDALRRVLAVAARSNLDVGDLPHLEPQLCGGPRARTACQDLDAFWMLAMALEQPQEIVSALEAQRGLWCARGDEPSRALEWPGGSLLRTSRGTLTWPNGVMARNSSDSWFAPSGVMVRSSSGTLSYPTGVQARSSRGSWSLPSGVQVDEGRLASLACQANQAWCRFFLGELGQSGGVRRDFAQLGLGRLAGQADVRR